MKSLIVLTISAMGLAWGSIASAKAEFQIFLNYRGANRYDAKLVSDWDYVVTAAVLYFRPEETPTNAACFKGDPREAVQLFQAMVNVMNRRRKGHAVKHWAEVFQDPASGKMAISVVELMPNGSEKPWFPRIRECTRWSTALERKN